MITIVIFTGTVSPTTCRAGGGAVRVVVVDGSCNGDQRENKNQVEFVKILDTHRVDYHWLPNDAIQTQRLRPPVSTRHDGVRLTQQTSKLNQQSCFRSVFTDLLLCNEFSKSL